MLRHLRLCKRHKPARQDELLASNMKLERCAQGNLLEADGKRLPAEGGRRQGEEKTMDGAL